MDSTDNIEILISASPWNFERFEVENIIYADGFEIQESDIALVENQRFSGQIIKFNSNGTGTATANQLLEFNWKLESTNKLKLSNGYIYNLTYDVSISDSQLTLSSDSFIFQYQDPESGRLGEITYEGRILFK
ncbi:hypothetical protein [Cellulophaga tyrosinoxydans]|nr:hypothetical protein [Cellulophaga tyrosinoxydans]